MSLLTETADASAAAKTTTDTTAPSSGGAASTSGEKQTSEKEPLAGTANPADQKKSDNGGEKPQGAPATYELRSPVEGEELDPGVTAPLIEVARELGLSNDVVQKVVDKMAPALREQSQQQVAAMVNSWAEAAKADKEIGGAKLQENLAIASKALSLGGPDLRKFLGPVKDGGTGLGNHPELLRWALRVGKALSEDTFVSANGAGESAPKSLEERIYGKASS